MDGWANNSAYTSGNSSSGGWGNSGSSATSNGYSGSSSSDHSYWSGVYGANGSSGIGNTLNPAYKANVYSTPSAQAYLSEQIANKRASPQEVDAAKAMVAGKQTVDGMNVAQSITDTIGAGFGPVGLLGSKALGWATEKAIDATSDYGDSPSYSYAKGQAQDDSSYIGTAISLVSPNKTLSAMGNMLAKDNAGGFNEYTSNINKSLISNGYSSAPVTQTNSTSSSGSDTNSLLKNMQLANQQTTTDTADYSPIALNYNNDFNFYSGSVA